MASFTSYLIPEDLAASLTQEQTLNIKRSFAQFDANSDGSIDMGELTKALAELGENASEEEVKAVMKDSDTSGDGSIQFPEFVRVVTGLRGDDGEDVVVVPDVAPFPKTPEPARRPSGAVKDLSTTASKSNLLKRGFQTRAGGGSAYHSYSDEERSAFTEHINNCLSNDELVKPRLPIDAETEGLFSEVADGIVLCKLINMAEYDTVDMRALNIPSVKKPKLSIFQKIENMNLALNAARAIGCVVTNVNAKDVIDGNPILILGLIWQIIRIQLLSSISLAACPELVCLLEEGEDMDNLVKLQPETLLVRWFNHHLERANSPLRVNNFGKDLADGEALATLLHQLDPMNCPHCPASDPEARANHVITGAKAMGVETFIRPSDITSANRKLMLAFVAQLFNTNPKLEVEDEKLQEFVANYASKDLDDEGDTREEKVFRMWINSLALEKDEKSGGGTLYINNLFADVQDGTSILRVMDYVQPGVVSWKRVNINPKNRYKKVENGNYVIETAKAMDLRVVNIGGLDIIDGNRKMTLAIMWQVMQRHTLNLLQSLSKNGKRIADPEIVKWACEKAGQQIRNFNDGSLSNGMFLLRVCHAVNPSVVNWDLVVRDATDKADKLGNAKYAVSVARKIGAMVFLAAEDIVDVKGKMIMLFCASLWRVEENTLSETQEGSEAQEGGGGVEEAG